MELKNKVREELLSFRQKANDLSALILDMLEDLEETDEREYDLLEDLTEELIEVILYDYSIKQLMDIVNECEKAAKKERARLIRLILG